MTAVIESMNGARFVHDQLELRGWDVQIADAVKVKGFTPLACKTDKIDAWVLAELSRRDLVPAIWLPTPGSAPSGSGPAGGCIWCGTAPRWRTGSTRPSWPSAIPPVSDLFGVAGRRLLDGLALPEPWAGDVVAALRLIDVLDGEIDACESALRRAGADHRYVPLLMTAPGIGWVLGYTIAAELGDITRFPTPKKLVGYTGLCPAVDQSGGHDWRGSLAKNGPKHLRWALIEAATHAAHHPVYAAFLRPKAAGTLTGRWEASAPAVVGPIAASPKASLVVPMNALTALFFDHGFRRAAARGPRPRGRR